MPTPKRVEIHKEGFRILWDDGHQGHNPSHILREACPCAMCVDEWTGKRRIVPGSISPDVQIADTAPVGNYAVSIAFNDGHNTGIFRFEYLRQLCQCEECTLE